MSRPSSSTISGTLAPPNPRWRTSTSATSVLPLSTDAEVSTRRTSMSRLNRSEPTPTANTGTCLERSESSSSAIGERELSAPSVSSTRPESGTISISRRAASSAPPSLVSFASNLSVDGSSSRSAVAPKRNTFTWNFWRSDASSALFGPETESRIQSARWRPARSAICMLCESSISTPTKFFCGTAAFSSSIGRIRHTTSIASVAIRSPRSTQRSRSELFPRTRR